MRSAVRISSPHPGYLCKLLCGYRPLWSYLLPFSLSLSFAIISAGAAVPCPAGRSSLSSTYKETGGIELSDILGAVKDGDVLAIECIGEIGETLGRGISGIINIFNPGLVIIGGRLIVGREHLLLPIRTAVNKLSMERVASDTKIRLSTLGRKAIVLGNCLLARKKLLGI